jgi:hypothetical protein
LATVSPKQTRRPAEKGSQLPGLVGFIFPLSSRYRYGSNVSGSLQYFGSWWSAQWLIRTVVPLGTSYPPILNSHNSAYSMTKYRWEK